VLWILRSALAGRAQFHPRPVIGASAVAARGRFAIILQPLTKDLVHRGDLDLSEDSIDATFSGRKKTALELVKQSTGKGAISLVITDGNSLPGTVHVVSASPHETRQLAATGRSELCPHPPEKRIGDLAYDSHTLDETRREDYGIELIGPHKSNRKKSRTQDGRALRRYCRRWKTEALLRLAVQFQTRD